MRYDPICGPDLKKGTNWISRSGSDSFLANYKQTGLVYKGSKSVLNDCLNSLKKDMQAFFHMMNIVLKRAYSL